MGNNQTASCEESLIQRLPEWDTQWSDGVKIAWLSCLEKFVLSSGNITAPNAIEAVKDSYDALAPSKVRISAEIRNHALKLLEIQGVPTARKTLIEIFGDAAPSSETLYAWRDKYSIKAIRKDTRGRKKSVPAEPEPPTTEEESFTTCKIPGIIDMSHVGCYNYQTKWWLKLHKHSGLESLASSNDAETRLAYCRQCKRFQFGGFTSSENEQEQKAAISG